MARRGGPARRGPPRPMAYRRGEASPRARSLIGPILGAIALLVLLAIAGLAGRDAELPSPTPEATPSGPISIRFSTALDPVSGEAGTASDRFRAGDGFAYSVRLAAPAGRDTVLVEILRVEAASTQVVQPPSHQGIVSTSRVIGFEVRATDLLAAWGPGDYLMRMRWSAEGPIVATGQFTLVETPIEP